MFQRSPGQVTCSPYGLPDPLSRRRLLKSLTSGRVVLLRRLMMEVALGQGLALSRVPPLPGRRTQPPVGCRTRWLVALSPEPGLARLGGGQESPSAAAARHSGVIAFRNEGLVENMLM